MAKDTAANRPVCESHDPEIWFPLPSSGMEDYAASLCESCPLRVDCLGWAIENGVRFGIWGGRNMETWRVDEITAGALAEPAQPEARVGLG